MTVNDNRVRMCIALCNVYTLSRLWRWYAFIAYLIHVISFNRFKIASIGKSTQIQLTLHCLWFLIEYILRSLWCRVKVQHFVLFVYYIQPVLLSSARHAFCVLRSGRFSQQFSPLIPLSQLTPAISPCPEESSVGLADCAKKGLWLDCRRGPESCLA